MLLGYVIDLYCLVSRFRIGGAQRSGGETPFVLLAVNECAVKIISIQKYNTGITTHSLRHGDAAASDGTPPRQIGDKK